MKSTYQNIKSIDVTVPTAIIYALDEVGGYFIEIKHNDTSYYINKNNEPIKYLNMETARLAAITAGAKRAYLALTKTSEETDLSTCHAGHDERYDYSSVPLELK